MHQQQGMPKISGRYVSMALGAVVALMAAPAWVTAQVAVALTLSATRALLFEDVVATVLIRNDSGQVLTLDSDPGPIRFRLDVESANGRIITRRDDTPLVRALQIMPGEVRELGFNVPGLFAIRSQGVYKIRAGVDMDGISYVSPEVKLEVLGGFELQSLKAGVSGEDRATRTYVLSYLQRDGIENIYLRIEDAGRNVHGLFNLGRVVRVRPAEMKVDEAGNVHILFQTMGMGFVHTAFTPYGVQLFSRTYTGSQGRASLVQQANGQITVPDGIETAPPAPATAQDKAALEKAKKKLGSGGILGKWMHPADE